MSYYVIHITLLEARTKCGCFVATRPQSFNRGVRVFGKELSPQDSDNFPRFVAVFAIPHRQSVPELCLQVLLGNFRIGGTQKGKSMQNGSMMRTERHGGTRRLGIQVARTW